MVYGGLATCGVGVRNYTRTMSKNMINCDQLFSVLLYIHEVHSLSYQYIERKTIAVHTHNAIAIQSDR